MKRKHFIYVFMALLSCFVFSANAQVKVATLEELQGALANDNNGLPILVTKQIVIPEEETVELDLNGKTVNSVFNGNSTTNHIYALSNKGTLTIQDSKGSGSINSRGIYNYGSLTLDAGAINAIDGNGGYAVNNQSGSTFVMNGGVVAATNEDDHQSSSGGYDATALKVPAGCTATLNGGTINSVCDFTYAIDAAGTLNIPETSAITVNGTHGAIYVSGGETTIDAGTFQIPADEYSRTDNVLYVSGGSLFVNGGTFIGDSDTASGGSCLCDIVGTAVVNGGTFKGSSGGDVWGTTGTTIKGGTFENLTEKQHIAAGYELNANGTVIVIAKPVAQIGETTYTSIEDAIAAAQAGSEIKLLADVAAGFTVPAGVTFNGNGFAISGGITAAGEITFAGVTKAASFNVENTNTVVNIPAGASLELTGGRMVIGHGCTFNITGSIADAKAANAADVTASLVMPGASFTGAGVTFNVTNAYISAPSSYCSSSKSASGTFNFNINNSIWENAGKLAFESQSTAATVNFYLVESVLNTGSHLVFGVSRGEVVIDNSNVNVGKSNQIENQSTMTIKNGAVVNGAVATSSNAKNPGTIIVEDATYAVTGEFSGSDLGTGTLVVKKDANVTMGKITKANIVIDATDMTAGELANFTANLSGLTGTLSVINNDKLEAKIVDGKVVLAAKPVAKIGEQGYATLNEAFAAATEGQTINMLDDATPALTSQRAITKAAVIDLGGKTMTLTEDDLYFGTTTFKNGTIVVDPSVKPSTAVFWMFANQTLTFDNVKVVATGVTGTYLIGLDGNNSDLNLLNGSEILVENTTALDLDIICVNASTGNDIKVENSKVNVTNLDGRVFFRGNYNVKDSEVNLAGITKAGFRIEAGQTLSIEGTSKVNIEGEPRDGGIHLTDKTAVYTKAATATVNATVNEPAKGSNSPAYVGKDANGNVRVWGEGGGNAKESFELKLYAGETLIATSKLNNIGGIINGNVFVTWNFFYPESNDEYWTTTWEEGHPNSVDQPTKLELIIDGTVVATTNAMMCGPDNLNPVKWEELGGVKYICTGLKGEGTEANPYLINNVEELLWFQAKVDEQAADGSTQYAGKYIKLTADIDLAGINWNPIGSMTGDHSSFKGVFDGGNHTISNLNIEQAGNGLGLFAYTSGNAVIKNLKLNNVTVKSTNNSNYVGGVVGNAYASTKIENVHVTGDVLISGRGYIGGIAGHGYVVMDNVSVVANEGGLITSTFWCAGGVLGYAGEGTTNITNAHVEGLTVTSAAGGLGAIVGMAEDNNGTQPISGSNLSAKNVAIKTYVGDYGTSYADYALGYLYGGNETSKLTGDLVVENVTVKTSSGVAPTIVDAVATVGDAVYFDFAAAMAYAKAGETITLLRDVEANEVILIGKSLTINGNGHKVTSNATRVFRVTVKDTKVTLNDVNMVSNTAVNYPNDVRGISIDDVTGVQLTLNNCSVDFTHESAHDWSYAVNVVGGSGHQVTVNGGSYEGANVINAHGANNTIVVKGATLTSLYPNNDVYYGACVWVLQNQGSSVEATGNTFNGSNAMVFNVGTGTTVTESNNTDNTTMCVAKIGAEYYTSLVKAFAEVEDNETIEVLHNVELTEAIVVNKKVVIDLNGKKVTSTAKKAFEVYADATIQNGTIEAAQRCVDTRKAVELTLTDVTLIADKYTTHGNPQPLTIGGSENGTKVTMTNVNISAAAGYGIITFVETELTATNSTIGGYNALYVKPGSDNSVFNFVDSDLSGSTVGNDVEGNSFSVIAVRANNVTVNVDAASTVTAAGNYSYAISFKSSYQNEVATGSSVTVAGEITGNILADLNGNTIKVKAEYADKLAAAGYATIEAENGLVAVIEAVAKNGDKYYVTLEEALDADGNEVELLVPYVVAAGETKTLDLKGKTVTMVYAQDATANHTMINNLGDLTIKSSVEGGKLSYTYTGKNLGTTYAANTITSEPGSVLTVKSGTIENLTFDSGVIAYAIDGRTNGGAGDVTVNIEGGVITSKRQAVRIFANSTTNTGALNISGGDFTGRVIVQNASAKANKAALDITGGTFNANEYKSDVLYVGGSSSAEIDINATVSGGTFKGEITETKVKGFISGGKFVMDVTEFCVFGYKAEQSGEFYEVIALTQLEEYAIVDGELTEFVNANVIEVDTLTYQRTIKPENLNKWQPLFVPFEIPVEMLVKMGYDVAYFNDFRETLDEDNNVLPDQAIVELVKIKRGTLKANHPYAIKAKTSEALNMTLKLTNAKLYQSDSKYHHRVECSSATKRFEFMGTYKAGTKEDLVGADGTVYVMSGGGLKSLKNGGTFGAFRLYMTITHKDGSPYIESNESSARTIRLEVIGEENENGETIIYDVVGTEQKSEAIFDMQGRRVQEPQKGSLYIVNGKKVMY